MSGPLASRVLAPGALVDDDLPPPHRPLFDLSAPSELVAVVAVPARAARCGREANV